MAISPLSIGFSGAHVPLTFLDSVLRASSELAVTEADDFGGGASGSDGLVFEPVVEEEDSAGESGSSMSLESVLLEDFVLGVSSELEEESLPQAARPNAMHKVDNRVKPFKYLQ